MASEVIKIGQVTKQEKDGTYYYFFPVCVFQAYPIDDYYRQALLNGQEVQSVNFDAIGDNLGTTNIIEYLDKAAELGYFSASLEEGEFTPSETAVLTTLRNIISGQSATIRLLNDIKFLLKAIAE